MPVSVKTTGLDAMIRNVEAYKKDLRNGLSDEVRECGNNTKNYAKANHRFKRKGGVLQRSVTFEMERKSDIITARLFLNDAMLTTASGKSYGTFIHEGTYDGYKQSPIAPAFSNTTGSKGWEADPFLYDAIKAKWNMDERSEKVAKRLARKYGTK